MSPQDFTQRFCDRLRARMSDAETTSDEPLSVEVKLQDDTILQCSLGNIFASHEDGQDADEAIEAFLDAIEEALAAQSKPPEADCIIPTVRSTGYLEAISLEGKDRPLHHPLAGDLWVVYAFDLPSFVQGVMPADCERLGLTEAEIREIALENLPAHVEEPELHWMDAGGMITAGGYHEASLLLLDELWEELAKEIEGDLIACVPARDTLVFTSTGIEGGVTRTLDAAITIVETGDHVNSSTLLRRTKSGWEVYEATAERALIETIHEAIRLLMAGDAEQARAKLANVSDRDLAAELIHDVADEAVTEQEDAATIVRLCEAALALSPSDPDLRQALEGLRSEASSSDN